MKAEERLHRNAETSEKAFERRLVEEVKKMGAIAVKMKDEMNSGLPDRLIVLPDGKSVWVELKSAGKDLTPLQKARKKELEGLGHTVYVVKSREDLGMVVSYMQYFCQ